MKTEFEAKYPKINKEKIRKKLKLIGAKLVFSERKFRRVTFVNSFLKKNKSWIRLRDEGDKVTLAVKSSLDRKSINGMKEFSIEVEDFSKTKKLLESIGLQFDVYAENYREEWRKGNVIFDIDTWPLIEPYLEVEATNEMLVRKAFGMLGFDYKKAVFGPLDEICKKVYGINILKKKKLVF